MGLLRAVFGIAFLGLACLALVLGQIALCLLEARYIVRLVNQLAPAAVAQPDAACRATCDR